MMKVSHKGSIWKKRTGEMAKRDVYALRALCSPRARALWRRVGGTLTEGDDAPVCGGSVSSRLIPGRFCSCDVISKLLECILYTVP